MKNWNCRSNLKGTVTTYIQADHVTLYSTELTVYKAIVEFVAVKLR